MVGSARLCRLITAQVVGASGIESDEEEVGVAGL